MSPTHSTPLLTRIIHKAMELGEPPALLRDKVKKGELGKKTGKGFYSWST